MYCILKKEMSTMSVKVKNNIYRFATILGSAMIIIGAIRF